MCCEDEEPLELPAPVIEMLAADGFRTRLADWLPHAPTLHKAQESEGRT